jgi:hypothetical protein
VKKGLLALTIAFAAAALVVFVGTAAAANGKLPQATDSTAGAEAGAALSDGTTPAGGGILGGFTYNGEAGLGTHTTVIDWQLPPGVTVHVDADECGGLCLDYETNCDPSVGDPTQVVTVDGNVIHFRLACDSGEGFDFEALLDSLISAPGDYDMSVQFKTTTLRRTANNMWQIKLPGSFGVSSCFC